MDNILESEKSADDADTEETPQVSQPSSRKPSFSDALNKFTTSAFTRRRSNNNNLTTSSSTNTLNHRSRIPTPSGIPRSTSFFNSLNAFASRPAAGTSTNGVDNPSPQQPPSVARTRKVSERLSEGLFFSPARSTPTAPYTPGSQPSNHKQRNSSVKIMQRALMKPIEPTPPRSQNLAAMDTGSSPRTPNFARPTSSSAARQRECYVADGSKTPSSSNTTRRQPSIQPGGKTPTSGSATRRLRYNLQKENRTPTSTGHARRLETAFRNEYLHPQPQKEYMANQRWVPPPTSSSNVSLSVQEQQVQEEQVQSEEQMRKMTPPPPPLPPKSPRTPQIDEADDELVTSAHQTPTPSPTFENLNQITTAKPSSYWLGRVSAISDRFRGEELSNPPPPPSPSPTATPPDYISPRYTIDRGMQDDERRIRRVFIFLHSMCMNDEARASLAEFKEAYENRVVLEGQYERGEKTRPKKRNNGNNKKGAGKGKKGVLEKLMGKRKSEG